MEAASRGPPARVPEPGAWQRIVCRADPAEDLQPARPARKTRLPSRPHPITFLPTTGISQKDTESIREVIHQLRAGLPEVEVLLASGVFGMVDPRDPEALAKASHSGTGAYGQALKNLAVEENCAYLDM